MLAVTLTQLFVFFVTFCLLLSYFITFELDCDSTRKYYLQKPSIYRNFKPFCLCTNWNSVLALFKGEGAVNELWTINTVFVYFNNDSSVSIVIKLLAEWFEVWIPTLQERFCYSKWYITLSVQPIGTAVVSREYIGQGLQLTTPIPPVQNLRMEEEYSYSLNSTSCNWQWLLYL
jgi:hypothetical protein